MNAIYHIKGLCPRTDIDFGRSGFCVDLHLNWKTAVSASSLLTQESVNTAILSMHRGWLDGCGFNAIFDPDTLGFDKQSKKKGPNSRPLYDRHSIRVSWGEWGPEHITVPGNACGLDIGNSFCIFPHGRTLVPHNVDSIAQAHLLLVVFTFFAESLILNECAMDLAKK